MDPHSRLSQFNQRRPSAGLRLQQLRQMESKPQTTPNSFEEFKKAAGATHSHASARDVAKGDTKSLSGLASRPIASNARLRRDEKYWRDMHLAFIEGALSQKAKGKNEDYHEIVRQFSTQNIISNVQEVVPRLRSYLTALSHVVSKLDRSHISLVDAIVHMPWTVVDSAFVKSYISFIGMLVSARPEYLNLVSENAVQSMTYYAGRRALDQGFAEGSSSPLTRRVIYDRVHSLIQQLLSLIPTLPSTFYPILTRHFPHKRQSQGELVTYVRNLLRLSDYCPVLCDRVLGLIIDRTIQIDVEIQVELEELEAVGEEAPDEIFPVDIFDTVIGQEGDASDSESEGDGEDDNDVDFSDISSEAESMDDQKEVKESDTDTKQVLGMVGKLDSILEVIFKHLDRRFATKREADVPDSTGVMTPLTPLPTFSSEPSLPPSSPIVLVPSTSPPISQTSTPTLPEPVSEIKPDIEALRVSYFHSLLTIFERTILRTFKSRYTQFLLFWYSSLNNTFRDRFLGTVVSKVLEGVNQPIVTRVAAASYVASYVSRANFVDRGETRTVVQLLCRFIEHHLNTFDELVGSLSGGKDISAQNAEQHAVFYATVQAVFLIFCFRWRDLLEHDPNDVTGEDLGTSVTSNLNKTWLPELNVMQRAISSPLNPLKVCTSNVVMQFALVAQKVAFLYCFPIIEANKRADFAPTPLSGPRSMVYRKNVQAVNINHTFDADLSTFFPFDPYKLPRSSAFMDGIYREWTAVAIEDDDGDEDDEDEVGVDVSNHGSLASRSIGEGDMHMHGPSSFVDGDADVLGKSFGGMSISPVRRRGLGGAVAL